MKELEDLHVEAWNRCWQEITQATLICPFDQHRHDPKCYGKSESLSYWIGRADALRDLQRMIKNEKRWIVKGPTRPLREA